MTGNEANTVASESAKTSKKQKSSGDAGGTAVTTIKPEHYSEGLRYEQERKWHRVSHGDSRQRDPARQRMRPLPSD